EVGQRDVSVGLPENAINVLRAIPGTDGTSQDSRFSRPAPDSDTHSRANATMTECGPPPAGPFMSTAVPSAARVPAQDPSGRRLRAPPAAGRDALASSPVLAKPPPPRRCSSTSLATHSAQRVLWNFASRCARYLSTA